MNSLLFCVVISILRFVVDCSFTRNCCCQYRVVFGNLFAFLSAVVLVAVAVGTCLLLAAVAASDALILVSALAQLS